jgi:type I restriction enzyme S subunit
MIAGLRPYPRMKESGVKWLGEVTVGWEVRRNGRIFAQRVETGFPDLPILEVSRRTGVRVRDIDNGLRKQVMSDREMYKRAVHRDIAYNMMRMWQGAVGVVPVDGLVSPAYVVARPFAGMAPDYFAYLYRTDAYLGEVDNYSRGIVKDRNRLYWEQFKQIPTPCPPFAEQLAIVRFLDYADRRVHRYIRAKQKLINLLHEQKQAAIYRAVTRGLDPNVRLKPSGVAWLGDVPEHWEVRKLGTLFRRRGSGTTPVGDHYYGGGVPWVMTGDLNDGRVETSKRTVTSAAVQDLSALRMYKRGSLIVAMYGATIGKTGVLAIDACTNQACCVLAEPFESASVEFLQAVVKMAKAHLIEQSYGGGQPNINSEIVRALRVPVPPMPEQEAILRAIGANSGDTVIARAAREIDLLREYRVRLIADVVTGKLDVREAAARLPEDVGQDETPNDSECEVESDEANANDTEMEQAEA